MLNDTLAVTEDGGPVDVCVTIDLSGVFETDLPVFIFIDNPNNTAGVCVTSYS